MSATISVPASVVAVKVPSSPGSVSGAHMVTSNPWDLCDRRTTNGAHRRGNTQHGGRRPVLNAASPIRYSPFVFGKYALTGTFRHFDAPVGSTAGSERLRTRGMSMPLMRRLTAPLRRIPRCRECYASSPRRSTRCETSRLHDRELPAACHRRAAFPCSQRLPSGNGQS
jgi:hypothetical protein